MKAKTIKPLTTTDTGGAPYIKVTAAAKQTGLGLTLTKRIGTRKFGNTDYVSVAAVNAYIVGEPKMTEQSRPAPISPTS